MSPVNRTRSPRTGTLRSRLLAGAMAAAAVSTSGFPTSPVCAQTIVVSGGAVQSNSTPATYDSINVYGTDGSSNPSTYNADAALTLTDNLNAHDLGVFNVNADVSIGTYASSSSGIINLNAGTLTAPYLILGGVGSVTRSSGNYSTTTLALVNGATLDYGASDSITDSVSLQSGATLTLAKNLVITSNLQIQDGGAITRTAETISAHSFYLSTTANPHTPPPATTLHLIAGDAFSPYYTSYVQRGAVVNAAAGASLGYLSVYDTNGNGGHSTFNVNGDVTLTGANASSGGIVNLNAGTLTATQGLSFDGVGSVTRTAGNYSTNSLYLSDGAALGYGTGDTITGSVNLSSGAGLTLAKDLAITGGVTVDGATTTLASAGNAISAGYLDVNHDAAVTLDQNLTLSGYLYLENGGSISRTSETISALAFNVNNATLDLIAGDTFNPSYSSYVQYGAVVNAPAGTSLGYLNVYGTNGNGDRATFNVNGDVTLTGANASSGGIVNLNAGTLTATQRLSFDGVGSVTKTAGNYSADSLYLSNGAALGYGTGDTITSSVNLSSGAGLTLAKDLAITGGITVDGATTTLASAGNAISAGYLDVNHDAAVTLDQNLTLSGYLYLENGGSISRTSETISALSFYVNNATLDLIAGDTFNPGYSSYVLYGAVVNAPAGTSLGYLNVYGTNGNGDRATFNVNGDVAITSVGASSGGIVNLNAGTLTATQGLSFDGAGSVTQTAGNYSTNSLTLFNGAALGYGTGDTIANSVTLYSGAALTLAKDLSITGGLTVDGAATSLTTAGNNYSISGLNLYNGAAMTYGVGDAIANSASISGGSTLTLDQNLTLSGYLNLDNGGSISRTTETISALAFYVNNATLDLVAGDTFNPGYSSYVQYGAVVNAPAGTSLGYLNVQGTNSNGDHSTFNVNGDVAITSVGASSGGIVNLNAGTLTATQGLSFDGAGSVTQTAGNYSTNSLTLFNGAALGYGTGDTIANSVTLYSGAALTLAKDLSITGGLTIDGATTSLVTAGNNYSTNSLYLYTGAALTYGSGDAITSSVSISGGSTLTLDQNLTLSGYLNLENGGSISRTTETISALAFNVYNATLDLVAGDTFNPSYSSYVQYGAVVNAPAGTSLGYLTVYGTNGNGDHSTFNVNGDVTVNGSAAAYSDGVLNLIAGTLSTPTLSLSGVGSAGQSGGHYDVTNLSLYGGAALSFGLGDSIDSLSIMDAGSRLDELAPLTLTSLSLTNGGILHLGAFTGTGVIANWGLRMAGDDKTFLENLIFAGWITDGPSPLQVIFDPVSNMTYVTSTPGAVPEIDPNTAHGAVMLLIGAAGILERRLRRVAIARQPSSSE